MELEKNKEKFNSFYKLTMFFVLGSFIGCIFETLLCYYHRGYFESRRGLIYGPFNQVYGLGAVILVYYLEEVKGNIKLFFKGATLGGITEYLSSWIQENFFGSISWNYMEYPLNFDGRTSIYHMIWWGIISVIFMKIIYPLIMKIINKVKEKHKKIITITLVIFFLIDGCISAYASIRQDQRLRGKKATNKIEIIFDKYYSDSVMNKIYPKRKNIQKK